MGTSIHLWVERRGPAGWAMVSRQEERKSRWERDYEEKIRRAAESVRARPPSPEREALLQSYEIRHEWEMGKNYRLFAILADVRNFKSDALMRDGYPTRWTEHIISTPRGFPEDVSDDVLREATFYLAPSTPRQARFQALIDAHEGQSHSWVALWELLVTDWDVATHGEGVAAEGEDFLVMLAEELTPLGDPDDVRLVFFFN